ncbi:MAG: hypothetical protein QOC81_320 [Thermoanaerobaculia bacterium]|jgi:hypothetical protein|nr:hypothetical protein [Thermoanaerobaculia bacterium]
MTNDVPVAIPLRRRLLYLHYRVLHWIQGIRYRLGMWDASVGMPHAVKRRVVRDYASRYGARTLVETGTYLGDMIAAMARSFETLHSIELSEEFYAKARARFARRPHIHLHHGDSASELPGIVAGLSGRALFWLDAHYSGGATARGTIDTPIAQELREIFRRNAPGHVLLVDDARSFNGTADYPTIDGVREIVASLDPHYSVEVVDDIIRITPPR